MVTEKTVFERSLCGKNVRAYEMTDSNSKSWAEAFHLPVLSHVFKPRLLGMGTSNVQSLQLLPAARYGHSFPPRAPTLRNTNRKGIQVPDGQKGCKCPLVWQWSCQEDDSLTQANKRIVVSFIETGNPEGEAGLGDKEKSSVLGITYLRHERSPIL